MIVQLSDVTFHYPQTAEPSLSEVSLELRSGEITAVTGPLGAGCSTLLLVIGGLAPHVTGGTVSGQVRTCGLDPTTAEGRAGLAGRVGLLLPTPWTQLSGMSFTVEEEVAFGPANLGWPRERIRAAVERSLAQFGAVHLSQRDPHTLSGGELQRVIFAAVAATEPDLFLLDEPVQELDPVGARQVYHELLPRLAERSCVVVATTDIDAIVESARRAVVLERGSLIADGDPGDVFARPELVMRGLTTTVARIARHAGLAGPVPLTVDAVVGRLGP